MRQRCGMCITPPRDLSCRCQGRYLVQYSQTIGNLWWHPHTACQCLSKVRGQVWTFEFERQAGRQADRKADTEALASSVTDMDRQ